MVRVRSSRHLVAMAQHMNAAVDEDAALLQFPKEFENAETLLISEVNPGDARAPRADVRGPFCV